MVIKTNNLLFGLTTASWTLTHTPMWSLKYKCVFLHVLACVWLCVPVWQLRSNEHRCQRLWGSKVKRMESQELMSGSLSSVTNRCRATNSNLPVCVQTLFKTWIRSPPVLSSLYVALCLCHIRFATPPLLANDPPSFLPLTVVGVSYQSNSLFL